MLYVDTDVNQVYPEGDALNRSINEFIDELLIISIYIFHIYWSFKQNICLRIARISSI